MADKAMEEDETKKRSLINMYIEGKDTVKVQGIALNGRASAKKCVK